MHRTKQAPKASSDQPASDDDVGAAGGIVKEVDAETGGISENSSVQEKTGSRFGSPPLDFGKTLCFIGFPVRVNDGRMREAFFI